MLDINIKSAFIRKRNSRYNVYIEYFDEISGKDKQRSQASYTNKKDADKHLIDIKSSINNNKFIISKDITFVDRCYKYMEVNYRDASPTTIESRSNYIKTNMKYFFKNDKLIDITPSKLQAYINYLYDKYSFQSFKVRYGFARAVLREAYRLKEISENPCEFVKMPNKKEDEYIPEVYDREEVKRLIKVLEGETFEIPVLLMLTLGLRVGEACGLRWSDIDFKESTISINQILIYTTKQGILFKEPKTTGSKRVLMAPIELMSKLKKMKIEHNQYKLQKALKFDDIVCLNSYLTPYIQRTLYKSFIKFLDKHNFKKIRMHDLRHTNATMMILSGTDMKTVSERLGHTDIKISMNRYSHVLKEMDQKASENLSNIMFK